MKARAVQRALALVALAFAIILVCLQAASPFSAGLSHAASRKFERISDGKTTPGETIVLSEDEINSYLRYDYAADLPRGLSEPLVRFGPDRVSAIALVDLSQWIDSDIPLLGRLFEGKRPVEAVGGYVSSNGYGRADIESVRIGETEVPASAITFIIDRFVQPTYPEAVVGREVRLGYNIRQVRFERGRAVVVMN